MPTKEEALLTNVANQMMKGPRSGRLPGTPKQRALFKKRHLLQITWVANELPRYSSAVGAVLIKCLIKYGENKVVAFCDALKNCKFQGVNDPVHQLWLFLQKPHGKDVIGVYQRTVYAAKAYMEGRQTIVKIRPSLMDIFEWDDGWTVPDDLLSNWHPERVPGQIEEGMLAAKSSPFF